MPTIEQIRAFEADFQKSCNEHGVDAAFVLIRGNDEHGSLLMIGGFTKLSDFIEKCIIPNTVEARRKRH